MDIEYRYYCDKIKYKTHTHQEPCRNDVYKKNNNNGTQFCCQLIPKIVLEIIYGITQMGSNLANSSKKSSSKSSKAAHKSTAARGCEQ